MDWTYTPSDSRNAGSSSTINTVDLEFIARPGHGKGPGEIESSCRTDGRRHGSSLGMQLPLSDTSNRKQPVSRDVRILNLAWPRGASCRLWPSVDLMHSESIARRD